MIDRREPAESPDSRMIRANPPGRGPRPRRRRGKRRPEETQPGPSGPGSCLRHRSNDRQTRSGRETYRGTTFCGSGFFRKRPTWRVKVENPHSSFPPSISSLWISLRFWPFARSTRTSGINSRTANPTFPQGFLIALYQWPPHPTAC